MSVPDPNTFGGPVCVRRAGESEWREVSLSHGYTKNSRSILRIPDQVVGTQIRMQAFRQVPGTGMEDKLATS